MQPLGLDERGNWFGEIALQHVDEQNGIVDERLAPRERHLLGLKIHAQFAQGMGKPVRDHRVASALQRQFEPFERVAETLRLVMMPGDKTRLVGILHAARIFLKATKFSRRNRLGPLVMQKGGDARTRNVDSDRLKLAAT